MRRKKQKIQKYRLYATVTVSVITDVDATSPEEAVEAAYGRGMQGLCNQCSGGNTEEEWSLTGELDGEPEIVEDETIVLDNDAEEDDE